MPRTLRWLPFVLSLCSLSCALTPPDIYAFESLDEHVYTDPDSNHVILAPSPTCMAKISEPSCGHGVSIMTGQEVFVGESHPFKGKPWSQLKSESVYLPAVESYAPLATYIINSCKKMNCSADVDAFKVKLDSLGATSGK